jgi:hypothetical protein
MNWATAFYRWF